MNTRTRDAITAMAAKKMMDDEKQAAAAQHGGSRPGAGRKARYTTRTVRRTAHLPAAMAAAIEAEHGSLQAALERLAIQIDPQLVKLINTEAGTK